MFNWYLWVYAMTPFALQPFIRHGLEINVTQTGRFLGDDQRNKTPASWDILLK